MFDLAKQSVEKFPNMKVAILTRLPRYDLSDADPNSIKNKLSEYGNNVLKNLWVKNGCPKNIVICDQNLGCFGELRKKRYGVLEHPEYDGIHMRGPLAEHHYTNSVLRIFQDLSPKLQGKHLPKITKPFPQKTSNDRQHYPSRFQRVRPVWREQKPVYNNRSREPKPVYNNRRDEHLDCQQTRYQRAQRVQVPTGFRIPTQNRFSPFYNSQGNF